MRRARLAVLAAGLALAASFLRLESQEAALRADARRNPDYARVGESLRHGLRDGSAADRMPALPLLSAAAAYHLDASGRKALLVFTALSQTALLFALGGLLGAPLAGLLAGLLHASAGWGAFSGPASVQSWFLIPVLSAACVWVWRCADPTLKRSAAAAAAVGLSFGFRSTLIALPPLLALWALSENRSPKRFLQAILLLILPYLFLLPRAAALRAAEGRAAFLERHESEALLAAGAMGVVESGASDWRAVTVLEDGVAVWAARTVAANPLKYGVDCFRRLRRILAEHPVLYAAGFAGFLFLRRRREAAALALFPAYFIAAHSALSVHREYLMPALGPACVLACAAALLWGKRDIEAKLWRARSVAAMWAGAAVTACGFLAGTAALAAYAFAPQAGSGAETAKLAAAAARNPKDAWLAVRRGRAFLASGRFAEGRAEFARALAVNPADSAAALESARAAWLLGDAAPLLSLTESSLSADFFEDDTAPELLALRAAALIEDAKASSEEQISAWESFRRRRAMTRGMADGDAQRRIAAAAGEDAARFFVDSALRYRSGPQKARLIEKLAGFNSAEPWLGLELARQALLSGSPETARRILSKSPPGEANARRRWAELSVDSGTGGAAGEVLRAAAESKSMDWPQRLSLAERWTASGRAQEALGLIEELLTQRPGNLNARLAKARALAAAGKGTEGLALAEAVVAEHPQRLAPYLDLAALYENAGRRDDARKILRLGLEQKVPEEEARLHRPFLEERMKVLNP